MSNLITSIVDRMISIEELLDMANTNMLTELDNVLTERLRESRLQTELREQTLDVDIFHGLMDNHLISSLTDMFGSTSDGEYEITLPTLESIISRLMNPLEDVDVDTLEDVKVTLTQEQINELNVRTYKEWMEDKGGERDSCIICTELYKEDDKVLILKCDHIFHKKCIEYWLLYYSTTCPDCRRDQRE